MSHDDLIRRRFEGEMMHRYGWSYLFSTIDGGFPMVAVGDPEQRVIISA